MKVRNELLSSRSVPGVDSQVATESFVTCEESPLLAEMTPRKHSASGIKDGSEYMQIAGRDVETCNSVSPTHVLEIRTN